MPVDRTAMQEKKIEDKNNNDYEDYGEIGLRVSIRDTGMGIKPEDLDKLFTSFTRLEQKKNANIEGSGLGLSITKRLVTMMGGTIDVDSTYGKGSEFIFTLKQKLTKDGVKPAAVIEDKVSKDAIITCITDNLFLKQSVRKLAHTYNFTFEENEQPKKILNNSMTNPTVITINNMHDNYSGIDFYDVYSDYNYVPSPAN